MSPSASIRHRRPHWVVSGGFWSLLVVADLAILSTWAAFGTFVLALCCGGGLWLRRRRLLGTAGAPVVVGPAGTPVEAIPPAETPAPASPVPVDGPSAHTQDAEGSAPGERPASSA